MNRLIMKNQVQVQLCSHLRSQSQTFSWFLKGQWRPRRTVIFGSWGAEEFGLIGSAEYAEVRVKK